MSDASVGDWIAPRLHGFGGRVNQVVPDGFAAYARILHPAGNEENEPASWAEVSRHTGRTTHALMQWNSLTGVVHHAEEAGEPENRYQRAWQTTDWPGSSPDIGNAPPDLLAAILDVLAGFTSDPDDVVHGVWVGWGWLHEGAVSVITSWPAGTTHGEQTQPMLPAPELLGTAQLRHPCREYLLHEGPLRAALRIGHQVTDEWFLPQSPSLLWPADRSWCLATEVDFDSTLIGGPVELVEALLAAPALEGWPIEPSDDLTHEGDRINR